MDPHNPASFNHRTERLSTGKTYHFVDQIPENYSPRKTPTLLCVHGFPDLWFGWRNQIGPWVRQGYRVVVPDMLGYGGTDKPSDSSQYSTKHLCADLAALLDLLEVPKAVLIGHDWGAFTVGRFALWQPDRLWALVMLSVPYTPPSPQYIPMEEVARRVPNFGYQVYFSQAHSTKEVDDNLPRFLALIFQTPSSDGVNFTAHGAMSASLQVPNAQVSPSILNKSELEYYTTEFRKGMNGPLNYYRTGKYRHDEESAARLPTSPAADLPVLFLWGTGDPTATPKQIHASRKFIPRLQDIAFEEKGHWLMMEAKDNVTDKISNWLGEVAAQPAKL